MGKALGGYWYPDGKTLLEAYREEESGDPEISYPWNGDGRYGSFLYTDSGTSALAVLGRDILRLGPEDTVLLPEYLCGTIVTALAPTGAGIRFYRVKEGLDVDVDDLRSRMDGTVRLVLLIHYFGTLQPEGVMDRIVALCEGEKVPLVEDVTMSTFSWIPGRIGRGDYLVSGVRKWFAAPDGGVLAAFGKGRLGEGKLECSVNEVLLHQVMLSLWREALDGDDGGEVLEYLERRNRKNSLRYSDPVTRRLSPLSAAVMRQTDLEGDNRKRGENYRYWLERLRRLEPFVRPVPIGGGMEEGCVPYGVLLQAEERDRLNGHLLRMGLFPQIQWPRFDGAGELSREAARLSDKTLMVQCDPRLTGEDIDRYAEGIGSFYRGR